MQIVLKEDANGVIIDVIIRNVLAKNEAEAIGKFILYTNKIKAIKKLQTFCFPLDKLMEID
jgi:hypothetical protein